jgi:hypothetical protein
MNMAMSLRLDPETEALLERLAKTRGRTKSDVLRDALHRMADEDIGKSTDNGPWSLVSDLIGIADDGPQDLARNHKQVFRELVNQKKR